VNILLMIADDLGRMTGCYGEPAIRTPHIDRLARQGTRFDMAFTSTASCSASRSVIFTGLHTHETGQYGLHHDHHHFMTFADVPTAPAILNAAGWHTGIIGKVHVGPEAVYPWATREESATRDVEWVADRARAYFGARKSDAQPFFLTIGFIDPHRDETRGGFGNEAFGASDPVVSPDDVSVPPFLTDLPEVRRELADYYRSVHRLDRGVGLVLDALQAEGLEDDTLVVFLSDNGSPFLNSKTTLFDAGVHLPLILRRPGQKPGIANPNLVSFTDILPTFLDVAGTSPDPGKRRGRSLLPILEAETLLPGWDRIFGSHTFHEITNYWPTRFLRQEPPQDPLQLGRAEGRHGLGVLMADLFVREPRRLVGDRGDRGDLEAEEAGEDDLRNRGHAHGVRAEDADRADLGRGFEGGAGIPGVDPFGERDALGLGGDLSARRAGPGHGRPSWGRSGRRWVPRSAG
jgi:N-sulfoglucosamine sulfohydrolase